MDSASFMIISAALKIITTFLVNPLIWVVQLVLLIVQMYYEVCWANGNWLWGMTSIAAYSILAPEACVGPTYDVVYFVGDLANFAFSTILYFLENLDQLLKVIFLLIIGTFTTDSVLYLLTRSRAAVAEETKGIRAQKEALNERMAAVEDWRKAEEQKIEDLDKECKHWQGLHGKAEQEIAWWKMKVSIAESKRKDSHDVALRVKGRENKVLSDSINLMNEVERLKKMIAKTANVNSITDDQDELKRALDSMRKERDACKMDLHNMKADRDVYKGALEEMTNERDACNEALQNMTANRDANKAALEDMTNERNRILEEGRKLKAAFDALTDERNALQNQLNGVTAERNCLQNQLNEMTANRDHLQHQLNGVIAERNSLQNQLYEMTANRDHLQHELNGVSAERDSLQWKVYELEKEKEERDKEMREVKTAKVKARAEAARLRTQLADARKEIEALKGVGGSGGAGAGAGDDVPIDPALLNA